MGFMKRAVVLVVLALVVVGGFFAFKRSAVQQARDKAYAKLKRMPPVSKDFKTPEGAILCLEDAYRRRDIEAAIAAKDFKIEAKLMFQSMDIKFKVDDEMISSAAVALIASFRAQITAKWPDFEGLESFFTEREPYADGVVCVTEMCHFPDGAFSRQQILVAETSQGWRVLNPVPRKQKAK